MKQVLEPVDEIGVFTYIDWQDIYLSERPFQIFSALSDEQLPGQVSTNLIFKDAPPEVVHDVRGAEHQFSIAKHGFAFCKHELGQNKFLDAEQVERLYLPQMEALLHQKVEDVEEVYFFDWRIRKNVEIKKSIIDANDKMQHLLPARHVHIDQTPSAAIGRIRLHLPADADRWLQGRVRIINLWRPLVDVVEERPLAICDMRSIDPNDLVEADHIRKQYNGTNYYAKPSNHYRWHYLRRQTCHEVTLIQMFDSAQQGVSGKIIFHIIRNLLMSQAVYTVHSSNHECVRALRSERASRSEH
jgi:hypothetical protein